MLCACPGSDSLSLPTGIVVAPQGFPLVTKNRTNATALRFGRFHGASMRGSPAFAWLAYVFFIGGRSVQEPYATSAARQRRSGPARRASLTGLVEHETDRCFDFIFGQIGHRHLKTVGPGND